MIHIPHFTDTQIMVVIGYLIVLVIAAVALPIESFILAFIGFILGFLFRPAIPLIGQVPFSAAITGGLFLHGIEKLTRSYAQESFEYMVGFAIVGGLLGYVVRYLRNFSDHRGKST